MADSTPEHATDQPVSALQVPIFRAVWLATIVSNFGGMIQSVAAAWLMTSLTTSTTMVALVQASSVLPLVLLALCAGAIADNMDRRIMIILAQLFMLCVSAILAIVAWAGLLTPWLLLTFTFLIGIGAAFHTPAWQASVGDMVPRGALRGAVALNSMSFNIARSVGPALGGAIVATAGAAAAFGVNSVTYIGLIIVLLRWRQVLPTRVLPPEGVGEAMHAGIRYASMSPDIRRLLIRSACFGFSACAASALMPLIAKQLIGGGPIVYGMLLGAFGVGAVCGAFVSTRFHKRFSAEQVTRIASGMLAAGTLVAGLSTILPLTMFFFIIAGAGWVLTLSTFNATIQLAVPRWVVGRSLALYQSAAFGGIALGSWVLGEFATHYGVADALLVAALLQVGNIGLGFWLPLPRIGTNNLDLRNTWQEPETVVPVEARSGPIVVTIEYRIAPPDIIQYLAEMNELRRIRVRDGAQQWSLLRDLADPELWIERYHFPTWLSYVRHNKRRTEDDTLTLKRLHALHKGPEKPLVHRLIERRTGSLPMTRLPTTSEMSDPITDSTRLN